MIEVAIPWGEHKDPKELIQGGIKGEEKTLLGDEIFFISPAKKTKILM